jgi:hypothetical protein
VEAILALLTRLPSLFELVLDAIEENVHLAVDFEERVFGGHYGNGFEFFLRLTERQHRGRQGTAVAMEPPSNAEDPAR